MQSNKKINLAVDIRSVLSRPMTGVGVYTLRMIESLASLQASEDFSLQFFSAGSRTVEDYQQTLLTALHIPTTHIRISNRLLNLLWAHSLYFPIEHYLKNADFIWLPSMNFFHLKMPLSFALTIHDLSFLHEPQYYSLYSQLWHFYINLKSLARRATTIITVSEHTKNDILNYFPFVEPEKINIIYPAITMTHVSDGVVREVRERYQLPNRFILFVGTLEPRKNIAAILKSFALITARYPSLQLIFVGSSGWRSSRIQEQIKTMPQVRWLQYVSDEHKTALYQLASVFIWPSLYEGFGFPPLESLSQGTPVITSYRTSLPEILKNNAVYVNPYNYDEIARTLVEVLDSPPTSLHTADSMNQDWHKPARELIQIIKSSYENRH